MAYKREIWTQTAQAWLSSTALGLTAHRWLLKEHLGIKSARQINNTCFTDFGLEVLIGIGQVDLERDGKLLFVEGKVDISDEAQLFVSEYFETLDTGGQLLVKLSKTYLQQGLNFPVATKPATLISATFLLPVVLRIFDFPTEYNKGADNFGFHHDDGQLTVNLKKPEPEPRPHRLNPDVDEDPKVRALREQLAEAEAEAAERNQATRRIEELEQTIIEKTQIIEQVLAEIERHQEELAELKKQDTNEEIEPLTLAEQERKVQLDKQRAAFETAARKKEKRLDEKAADRLAILNRESPKHRSDWSDALTKMSQSDQKDKKNVSNASVEALRKEHSERRKKATDDSSESKPVPKEVAETQTVVTRSSSPIRANKADEDLSFECGECASWVPGDASFCPSCETSFADDGYDCSYCGAEINIDASFCPSCGEAFQQ